VHFRGRVKTRRQRLAIDGVDLPCSVLEDSVSNIANVHGLPVGPVGRREVGQHDALFVLTVEHEMRQAAGVRPAVVAILAVVTIGDRFRLP